MKSHRLGHPILKMQVRYEPDIVTARQKTRRIAGLLGFDHQDQARLATAVSELARNVYQYASGGTVEFYFSENSPQTFFIRVSDQGPGISNLQEILNGSYVSPSGMGVGLIGSKKLMDFFEIETIPEKGTKIIVGKSLDRRARPIKKEELPGLAIQLSQKQSDSPFEEIQNQNRDLMNALEDLRASKADLAELNQELNETNRGVVALYAELDEKAVSLQRANEIKTSFLSNMTHEFRTPLSSIISLTRMLLDRVDGELSTEQEKQVNYIRQSAEGLLELVGDLLDLAKVEAGKVSIQVSEFEIDELLGGVRGMFRPLLQHATALEFKVDWQDGLEKFETDLAKVSQILRNLISNAIKFTEHGVIHVSAQAWDAHHIHIQVSDTGIGIAPEFFDLIFEDFTQVESKLQKKQKGTGLGLPLSRKLARLLGGDLWVKSAVGQGSVFHVVIPRKYTGAQDAILFSGKSSAEISKKLHLELPAASAQFKVLLIDDDEPSRYVLKGLVGAELDAVFLEASDGLEGLEKVRAAKPDLVFLDLVMKKMDGVDVLQQIKKNPSLRDLPVIINSAKNISAEEREALLQNATAVLSKARTDQALAVTDLRNALVKAGFDYKGGIHP